MSERTKGKWEYEVDEFGVATIYHIGKLISEKDWRTFICNTSETNASFICLACNYHDRLVDALKKIASRTVDEEPPYRVMKADQMGDLAKQLLLEIEAEGKKI